MRASGYDRAISDWYIEPSWIVEALLDKEPFDGTILDPCCGGGNIPRVVLSKLGHTANATEKHDRGFGVVNHDFFTSPLRAYNIISNPPYDVLQEFVDHALIRTTHKVAVIARLAFLELTKRKLWFEKKRLARVWVSSKRVSMPPGGTDIQASGGSIAYAWFIFDHWHSGDARIGWL